MKSKNHSDLIQKIGEHSINLDKDMNHKKIIFDHIVQLESPIILEFGVNTGASSSLFAYLAEQNKGKVFSIDIKNCSDVVISNNWFFLQTNDLNTEKILDNFKDLYEGIDLIFIDSYHDADHVEKLTYNWFPYLKKGGIIFFDDTDNLIYKLQKRIPHTINVGEINNRIKQIYHSNENKIYYSKYYGASGLSKYYKLSEFMDKLNPIKKFWDTNFLVKFFYLKIRKTYNKFTKK
tara:strand:- start:300 stop:1001 length:702 start_codon:yes stop_codon:yes gene_type:complete